MKENAKRRYLSVVSNFFTKALGTLGFVDDNDVCVRCHAIATQKPVLLSHADYGAYCDV